MTRAEARQALATLLESSLPTSLVEVIEPNLIINPDGRSPIVIVMSAGSKRKREIVGMGTTTYRPTYRFGVLTMVAEADPDNGWTEADVEDRLDAIEEAIATVVMENAANEQWSDLSMNDEYSIINPSLSEEAGIPYVTEERYVYMTVK